MFFDLLDILLGTGQSNYEASEPANYERSNKIYADKMAEANFEMMKESDPLKKEKMLNRIALGVYDFSDLK